MKVGSRARSSVGGVVRGVSHGNRYALALGLGYGLYIAVAAAHAHRPGWVAVGVTLAVVIGVTVTVRVTIARLRRGFERLGVYSWYELCDVGRRGGPRPAVGSGLGARPVLGGNAVGGLAGEHLAGGPVTR